MSAVRITNDLLDKCVPITDLIPNTWNPNEMESSMRDKLVRAISMDTFSLPIIVRPHPSKKGKFEIIDGEHRWMVAKDDLSMTEVPIINLGDVDDVTAQQITIKMNTLRGEFDSIKLGNIVKGLYEDVGRNEVIENLPMTTERLDSLVDLVSSDITAPLITGEPEGGDDDKQSGREEFKSFNGNDMQFDNQCPRCLFEFNNSKSAEEVPEE